MTSWDSAESSRPSMNEKLEDDDAESESVSQAGDIGDRVLHGRQHSSESSGGQRLSLHGISESRRFSISDSEDPDLQQHSAPLNYIVPVNPSAQNSTPVSTNGKFGSQDIKQLQEPHKKFPKLMDYVSYLIHLAVLGILGVLTRYLLQKFFGPGVTGVTSDETILYADLPANMVGSFLMGWFGVVFKGDISHISDHLAVAITTGYLGSLTTFSAWNQKMLELSVKGHWLFSMLGFFIGLFLVVFSIIFGIETAKGFKWLLIRLNMRPGTGGGSCISKANWKVDSIQRQLVVTMVFLVLLGLLWGVTGALEKKEFKHGGNAAQLWFACLVGPLGVWIRWFLARLNGRGIGPGLLKWLPFGTLIVNVSGASLMAALATVKKSVNSKDCDTVVVGFQIALGCLSTVSTFVAEFNAMRESTHPWRAYAYAMITIGVSFCLGILIYCIPVWTMSEH